MGTSELEFTDRYMKRREFLKVLRRGLLLAVVGNVIGSVKVAGQANVRNVTGQQHLTLFLCGDVMTGRGVDQILPSPGKPELHETFVKNATEYVRLAERENGPIPKPVDYRYIWGDALQVWQTAKPDFGIANLETSITISDDFWSDKSVHYRMQPRNLSCLTAASIDCYVLANNHVLDFGYAGLTETLVSLRRAGLSVVGAGETIDAATSPIRVSLQRKGNVLVFGFADRSSGVPENWRVGEYRAGVNLLSDLSATTARRVAERIRKLKKTDDTVIVSIHWGSNWGYDVPVEQRDFAHHLIDDGGVDIVHGHSSHHPKSIEFYRNKAIIYGCGDFLNDYEGIGGYKHYRPWLSLMYLVTLSLPSRKVENFEIVPLSMKKMRLAHASAEDRRWLTDKLNTVSADFSTGFHISEHDRLSVSATSS
jgi:poly-gamma-glutamate synthesis protein (capsule biosynthesis protein)